MCFLVSEVPLYIAELHCCTDTLLHCYTATLLQGYLAHKKTASPYDPRVAYAQGHMVLLGAGRFLMSEVPLYTALQREEGGAILLAADRAPA